MTSSLALIISPECALGLLRAHWNISHILFTAIYTRRERFDFEESFCLLGISFEEFFGLEEFFELEPC